jgi:hypothetical protein
VDYGAPYFLDTLRLGFDEYPLQNKGADAQAAKLDGSVRPPEK